MMTFSEALGHLKNGEKIARKNWNGKGMWLEIQKPDDASKMTRPYVFMSLPPGSTQQFNDEETYSKDGIERVPWLCSQTDLLASDWQIISF